MTAPQALDVFGVPLGGVRLIEASAGTGKTWAICGLYLRLLLERHCTVQQILVVTFTNAATAELRERLRQRLVDTLAGLEAPATTGADPFVPRLLASLQAQGAEPADLAARLRAALLSFDEAAIFTIHGFCQRALADTPLAAQMPLVQDLLADDSALLAEAVHDFWRRHVAGPEADPVLTAHLLELGDSPARWLQLLQRQLARPLARLLWPDGIDGPDDRAARDARLADALAAARAAWPAQREAVLALLLDSLPRLHAAYYKPALVQAAVADWDAVLTDASPPAVLPANLALLATDTLDLRTKKGQTPPEHPFFGLAQALLDAATASTQALQLARLRLLRRLLHDGAEQQRAAKRAQRVVAFDDMLANLHQRLHDYGAPGLAAALRQRFPAALIDEFQDTDPLQWAVFRRIYADPPQGEAGPPLFLVGDPKQAIYSFRHADLHTYLQARSEALATYTLGENQRAVGPLISALNTLFTRHGNAFLQPGLRYHPVTEGAKPKPPLVDATEPRAALQVWTLPRSRSGPLPKLQARQRAAATCAAEIARLLTEARAGRITLAGRPLAAGHIAVLVRSHSQGSAMRQALATLGVGSVELSQASVFHGPDAEELERVLAAMLQPGRDGLLKAALATRWHGLEAHAIDALAGDEAAWLDLVQRYARHGSQWRQRGVGVVLQQWRQSEQVAQRLLAAPDGARRLTNLLHLGELLHQASATLPSPEALLRWLQAQRDSARGDEATQLRLESDQHLVQIVTIHKSKGLEYPIVFCPFLWDGRLAPGGDGLDGVPGHDDDGQAVLDFRAGLDAGFDPAAAKAQAKAEAAAETLRLVYVALTRAVHRCYLLAGSYSMQSFGHVSTTESARSLLNWLLLGDGLQAADWFNPKRKVATPSELDAAWTRLAAPSVVDVSPLPALPALALPPASDGDAPLQALRPPAPLPRGWWIGSFSQLAASADAEAATPPEPDSPLQPRAGADHDSTVAPAEPDAPATALPAQDVLRFPRGTEAGVCVHTAFELADFSDPRTWPAAATQALQRHPPQPAGAEPAALAAMLQGMLADVLTTPLPVGTARPLQLQAIGNRQRLVELEFHLPAPRLSAAALARTLAAHGWPAPRLGFGQLHGYLKGFIDLVLQHDGRWFVLDWKSNHLGDRPADYADAALQAAMADHHYPLQALLYSLALQRWLQHRLPGYRHDQHFGGALYLFVRGLRPGWRQADGMPTGVQLLRPSAALLADLSALLDGETA
ncbi:exodeoxyribonuclease V subunit beta [Pseudaquabacterium pictum]|uniref:RecBCD enzyme subunit RecB n=1 Tax=Pseudaquabacterium pictum TaxID=2315236 RepID=A0A480AH13_9BURK|nr:exodeoxyribonuclease V subunit beta [Rubrivivax pictus]GCL60944.1 RecBCD enzyme subunit RecB [Rubrivivax pictus]